MGKDESLEDIFKKEINLKNLFNQDKCFLEIAQHHITFCKDYGTEICKNSKYRSRCSYVRNKK